MNEVRSLRRQPFAARRLVLGTLAVVAVVATTAGVARWRAVPAASVSVQTAVVTRPPGGAARADSAIAPVERADAPSDLSDAQRERSDAPSDRSDAPPGQAGAPPARAAEPPAGADASHLPPRVEAYARDAVDRFIDAADLEGQLGEAEREVLVTALGEVRASSRWLSRHAEARGEDESRRRQALLDADRVFREMLGVRLGEFVAALAPPGTVEDLGAARR